jgi:hypothetical protein
VGYRQLSKAGFKTVLIERVNLSKLNSEATAAMFADTVYNATQCEKVNSRMCNLESDPGFLKGRDRLHETPVRKRVLIDCASADAEAELQVSLHQTDRWLIKAIDLSSRG